MSSYIRSTLAIAGSALLGLIFSTLQTGQVLADEMPQQSTSRPYLMGVFPHLPPRELEKVFAPMAADLAEVINHDILFRSSTTYEKFTARLDKQEFDIAFVQPFDYVRAADNHGYLPLATRTQRLSAILVAKPESRLTDSASLKGKGISLPPESAAVSHLVKNHLMKKGLDLATDIRISHHRSHISCMQQVLIGAADACGTAAPALRFFEKRMKVKLKTVMRTMDIPHALFSIHPRVPKKEREKIRQRILNWANTEKGRALLKRGSLKPFVAISDADYDIVRKMEIAQAYTSK